MKGHEEEVLVVERRVVEQAGMFQGLSFDIDRYLPRLLAPGVPRFMLRSAAETNPSFKQLIPYVIMTFEGDVLCYVRGSTAGEKRLVGKRSIGIGGHINDPDAMPLFEPDFFKTYQCAVEREVREEILIDGRHQDRVVGLLNDDSTEVGTVHLGIVHHWTLESAGVRKQEKMMAQLEFVPPQKLRADRNSLETWSQLCLDQLEALTGVGRLDGHRAVGRQVSTR